MPKQPILPVPDWSEVFDTARSYPDWLAAGKAHERQAENHRAMEDFRQHHQFDRPTMARLNALDRPVRVLVIAEDWCPDVVRHVPILQRMAELSPALDAKYLLLNDRPDILCRYLTFGGEAIPKFVFFNADFVECGLWGPMPEACRRLIARGRGCGDLKQARKQVAALYEADPERRMVAEELIREIETAACERP